MEAYQKKVSLRDFLYFIFKNKFLILSFFVSIVFIVAIVNILIDPRYEAKAQIMIKVGRENIFIPTSRNINPVISTDTHEQINTEIEILKSLSLAQKTVAALGPTVIYKSINGDEWETDDILDNSLENKIRFFFWHQFKRLKAKLQDRLNGFFPRDQISRSQNEKNEERMKSAIMTFQESLEVEQIRGSNLINVRFKHKDPQMAATVVNKLTTLYLGHRLNVQKTLQSSAFFQLQSEILKNEVKEAEEELKVLKKQHNLTSFEDQKRILLEQAAQLRAELNRTVWLEAEAGNRIEEIRQQLAVTSQTIAQEKEIDHNPYLISDLQARLVELELEEKQLLTKYTEGNHLVNNVRKEIRLVQKKLAEYENKQYGRTRSGINPTFQSLREELLRNEAELKALTAKKNVLHSQMKDYQIELDNLNKIEVQYNQLQQELEVDRQNYQLYLTKFEESRISDAMDAEKISSVNVVESAQPPIKPVSPNAQLNMAIAILIGSFGGIGIAICKEYLNDRIDAPADLEHLLDAPVLASIPKLKL